MKILIAIAVLSVLFAAYVVWLRPWMRDKEWAKPFFEFIEPIEIALWWKSETVLKARAKMLLGLLLTLLTQIGTIDITPLMPIVPEKYQGIVTVAFNLMPLILTLGGWVDEQLRKDTTKPLELVAVADKVIAENPKLAETIAVADEAKVVAVAEIKTAEAKAA